MKAHDRRTIGLLILICVLVAAAWLFLGSREAQTGLSIASPDTQGNVGEYSSLALDEEGNPVIAYRSAETGTLHVLRCDDPRCQGDEMPVTVDSGDTGYHTAIVLDEEGNPVVAYATADSGIMVLHCDDPACAPGGDSFVTIEPRRPGGYISLVLDEAGNPVLAYYEYGSEDLKVLHCDDPNCAGIEISTTPDKLGDVGSHTSLVLDTDGNPVISYLDATNEDLKVLHCDDPRCAGDERPTVPESIGEVGWGTSLVLDAAGNPVVSYYSATFGDLRLLHCDDPACAPGGDSLQSPDLDRSVGLYTSLALDSDGNPVIAYLHGNDEDVRIIHCDDPNCAGVETPTTPTGPQEVGHGLAMVLDANGNPIISYWNRTLGDLEVLHCGSPTCG